jgi:hypothetical protein
VRRVSIDTSLARFHLNNGARLERIDWLADMSRKGLRQSLGLMVNYLYEPKAIEGNHEKFVQGEIVASRQVRSLALGNRRSRARVFSLPDDPASPTGHRRRRRLLLASYAAPLRGGMKEASTVQRPSARTSRAMASA